MNKCPDCGITLSQEMIDANMCWQCGKILDESLLGEETLHVIAAQAEAQNPFCRPEVKNHKLTTGYCFEGYQITKYLGLVSGESVMGTGFLADFKAGISYLFGTESKGYSEKLKAAKKAALFDMIAESNQIGGNAVIGVTFGFVVFSGNMIGISVNGTSVKLEAMT